MVTDLLGNLKKCITIPFADFSKKSAAKIFKV